MTGIVPSAATRRAEEPQQRRNGQSMTQVLEPTALVMMTGAELDEAIDHAAQQLEYALTAHGAPVDVDGYRRPDGTWCRTDRYDSEDGARELLAERRRLNATIRELRDEVRSLRRIRAERELPWPIGLAEIAAMLGAPLNTAQMWSKRGTLPRAAGMVSGVPFWWRTEVIAWAERTGRVRHGSQRRSA